MKKSTLVHAAGKSIRFILACSAVHLLGGAAVKQLFESQASGKFARIGTAINVATPEIAIFGSSHANRHYVPTVFGETLSRTCYNAGTQGQHLLFHLAVERAMLARTTPELVVLNLDGNWLFESKESLSRLTDLHPFYWQSRSSLRPILELNSKFIDLQLRSRAYQFNSTVVHSAYYAIKPQPDDAGYNPLHGMMKPNTPVPLPMEMNTEHLRLSPILVDAFESFISQSRKNGCSLVFVISPVCVPRDYSANRSMELMLRIADDRGVDVLDFLNDQRFSGQFELFKNDSHLNDQGARLFSKIVAEAIQSRGIL